MDDDSSRSEADASEQIYHRAIEPDTEDANYQLLTLIAEIEEVDVTELPPMWERIDDFVHHLFEEPPSPSAQTKIEFSYYGYRITLDQSGTVQLVKLADERTVRE